MFIVTTHKWCNFPIMEDEHAVYFEQLRVIVH